MTSSPSSRDVRHHHRYSVISVWPAYGGISFSAILIDSAVRICAVEAEVSVAVPFCLSSVTAGYSVQIAKLTVVQLPLASSLSTAEQPASEPVCTKKC